MTVEAGSEGRVSYRTRAAIAEDAPALAATYNQGIEDRVATFETDRRTPADMAARLTPATLFVVAEPPGFGVAAFAGCFPYRPKAAIAPYTEREGECSHTAAATIAKANPDNPATNDAAKAASTKRIRSTA